MSACGEFRMSTQPGRGDGERWLSRSLPGGTWQMGSRKRVVMRDKGAVASRKLDDFDGVARVRAACAFARELHFRFEAGRPGAGLVRGPHGGVAVRCARTGLGASGP